MGICMSSAGIPYAALGGGGGGAAAAIVILMDGTYYQFSRAIKAEQMLRESPDHFILFLFYMRELLPCQELKMRELLPCQELQLGQIYFLLPRKQLQFVVNESDMACLLYKANSALKQMCTKYGVGDYMEPNFYRDPQIGGEEEKMKLRSEQLYSLSGCGSNNSKFPRSQFGSPRKQWRVKLDTIVEVA